MTDATPGGKRDHKEYPISFAWLLNSLLGFEYPLRELKIVDDEGVDSRVPTKTNAYEIYIIVAAES